MAVRIDAPQLAGLLTYPRFDEQEYKLRLDELRKLGVQSLMTGGRTTIGGVRIAGKGNVGLVIKAQTAKERICALKVRRVDANRSSMRDEVRLHTIANGAGVGPGLLGHSDNFMLMEYAGERSIADWAAAVAAAVDRESAGAVARSVLEQCYRLDRAGIDHGELSHLDNHVIVSDDEGGIKATVIDFESASTGRKKMCNVSAAGQSLLVSGAVAANLGRALAIDKDKAVAALKRYKWEQTRKNFDALLSILER